MSETARAIARESCRRERAARRRGWLGLVVLRGIPTADLERIAAAPGDAARLAQLANVVEAAYQRAKEPNE